MLSTYHVFSLLFCFFSFPIPLLCRLNFLLLVWKLYILLVVRFSPLIWPHTYLVTVLGLKSLSAILPFSVLLTMLVLWHLQGWILWRQQRPFLCHLARNWSRLLRALLEGTAAAQQEEQEVLCVWGLVGSQEGAGGWASLRALLQWAQTWSSSTACLPETSAPCFQLRSPDAVQGGVPQPTEGGKQMKGGGALTWKMIGSGRD